MAILMVVVMHDHIKRLCYDAHIYVSLTYEILCNPTYIQCLVIPILKCHSSRIINPLY